MQPGASAAGVQVGGALLGEGAQVQALAMMGSKRRCPGGHRPPSSDTGKQEGPNFRSAVPREVLASGSADSASLRPDAPLM